MLNATLKPILGAAAATSLAIVSTGAAHAQATSPGQIVGIWETDNGNVKLEMFESNGRYAARSIYGAQLVEADGKTFKKDVHNPDPKLRDRSLKGIVFISNLSWNARARRWEDGRMYVPSNGRTISARASMDGSKLELRAYMGTPMLGRTMVLHRAQ